VSGSTFGRIFCTIFQSYIVKSPFFQIISFSAFSVTLLRSSSNFKLAQVLCPFQNRSETHVSIGGEVPHFYICPFYFKIEINLPLVIN